jgi:predicted nucleotidyltransferase
MGKTSMTHPTPYPNLNDVLRELVESVQAVLSNNFVAACLQGSFAVGDFDRHSDVDFIIAVEEELSGDQVIW